MARNGPTPVCTSARKKLSQSKLLSVLREISTLLSDSLTGQRRQQGHGCKEYERAAQGRSSMCRSAPPGECQCILLNISHEERKDVDIASCNLGNRRPRDRGCDFSSHESP